MVVKLAVAVLAASASSLGSESASTLSAASSYSFAAAVSACHSTVSATVCKFLDTDPELRTIPLVPCSVAACFLKEYVVVEA